MDQLGRAKSVKVQKENTVIVDGEGDKAAIEARIGQIKKQIEETTSDFDKAEIPAPSIRSAHLSSRHLPAYPPVWKLPWKHGYMRSRRLR